MNAATCSSVPTSVSHSGVAPGAAGCSPSMPASGGSITSASTVARSSTTSQPTAMRPFIVSSTPRASSALSSTTVLAHDSEKPNTNAATGDQPHHTATPKPSAVAMAICTTAPGRAMRLTAMRSASEKCRPTPNIKSITPISDSSEAIATFATNPGVAGPMMTPATR